MTGPLCYEEACEFPCIAVVEGPPNGLAVIAQALASGIEQRVAPVVMPSSGSSFTPTSLACLKGKRARIFPDDDPPGYRAALAWGKQLKEIGCDVDCFTFEGLRKVDGSPVRDINDCTEISPEFSDRLEALFPWK